MELSVKTTILLSKRLYGMLKGLSTAKKQSIGELIRSACEKQYGLFPENEVNEAVEQLAAMSLPVDEPAKMKLQSVPEPRELLLSDDLPLPDEAPS